LLVSIARDPLLRATAPVVLSMSVGEEIARQRFTDTIREAVEGRLNDATLDKLYEMLRRRGRNQALRRAQQEEAATG